MILILKILILNSHQPDEFMRNVFDFKDMIQITTIPDKYTLYLHSHELRSDWNSWRSQKQYHIHPNVSYLISNSLSMKQLILLVGRNSSPLFAGHCIHYRQWSVKLYIFLNIVLNFTYATVVVVMPSLKQNKKLNSCSKSVNDHPQYKIS